MKLGFTTWKTSAKAQKIDGLLLKIYSMTSAKFLLWDSLEKVWFFEKIFLLANTNMEMVLKIPFSLL